MIRRDHYRVISLPPAPTVLVLAMIVIVLDIATKIVVMKTG